MRHHFDRRAFFTLFFAVTVSGFIVICTLGQSVHRQRTAAKTAAAENELIEPECVVREYCGRIGVFRGGSEKPSRIIDYDVSLLSEFDREQISKGIVIETESELRQLIEDLAT
ncbi:MAG TPA: hypothetical protein DCZ71_03280 [Ruminococcus sp.]|nr:hypothetical protein [Ruminococcus sp.]